MPKYRKSARNIYRVYSPYARSNTYLHIAARVRAVATSSPLIPDSFAAFCQSARRKLARSLGRHHDAACPEPWSVRRDFAPRPVSSHKGLPTDDVVPCLLRPICFSAISVAAIARSSLLSLSLFPLSLSLSPFVVCAPPRSRSRNGRRRVCMRLCAELAQLSLRRN